MNSKGNYLWIYIVVGLAMLIYVATGHSGSTESPGVSVCTQQYANMPDPVETLNQYLSHCVPDFDNYGK